MSAAPDAEAARSWQEAVTRDAKADATQALIGGLNFRIDVMKAFKAVYLSAKIGIEAKLALVTGAISPAEAMNMASDAFDIIVTTLDALREKMSPLTYTACVLLSYFDTGVDPKIFESALKTFLADSDKVDMPWYLGLTQERLQAAREELAFPNGFAKLLTALDDHDWLEPKDRPKLRFKPRHYSWGVSVS